MSSACVCYVNSWRKNSDDAILYSSQMYERNIEISTLELTSLPLRDFHQCDRRISSAILVECTQSVSDRSTKVQQCNDCISKPRKEFSFDWCQYLKSGTHRIIHHRIKYFCTSPVSARPDEIANHPSIHTLRMVTSDDPKRSKIKMHRKNT